MAKITRITTQKRSKSRYNLFLDRGRGEEYGFSVDEDTLIKFNLKKGLELTEENVMELVKEEEQKKVYYEAIRFLSYRMRSINEMETHLEKKGHDPSFINKAIEKLLHEKLLNDEEFAVAFVLTKKRTTLKGPNVIRRELQEKGVRPSIIEEALTHFPVKEQKELVKQWLEKQKQKKEANRTFIEKLRHYLQRRGFSYDVINETIDEVEFPYEEEKEFEAILFHGNKIVRKYEARYNGWEFTQRVKQALYRKGFSMTLIERFLEEREQHDDREAF